MSTKRDYYEILGVAKNTSDEDIKKAYRKLARENHPDVAKDVDKGKAEVRFKEINEAYQVLGDTQKRKMYDQFGHAAGNQQGFGGQQGPFGAGFSGNQGQWGPFTYSYSNSGGNPDFGDFDPFDVFEDVFGFRGFGGQRRQKKGRDLHYEMRVDFSDAVHGTEKEIAIESGKIKVKIPKGADNGTKLKFAQQGMPGPSGTPAGDLYITLRVPTPKEFERFGSNLVIPLEINFIQAVLGDTVDIPVIDFSQKSGIGRAKLKIPEGTQPGTQIRVRGKGMPTLNGGQGDVIVQIFISVPKKINRRQKELLEEYRRS